MPHHVYANGNEICAKSADGTSDMATDVCFSPGAPMPGVPVTYMNSCNAEDVTNGSRTVLIKGMEICLEDKSYFSTSYGDEAATQALKRGVVSTAVQGRCYFIEWSGNVFVEGLGVTRHLDLVTHNHSNPANTPPAPYMSVKAGKNECKKDKDQMEDKCKPQPNEKSMLERALGPARYKNLESVLKKAGVDPNSWLGSHCDGLMIKPVSPKRFPDHPMNEFASKIEEMAGDIDKIIVNEINEVMAGIADKILGKAAQAAEEIVERKLRNAAIRHTAALAGTAVGGVGAVVTEGAAAVWTIGDAAAGLVEGAGAAYEAWSTFKNARGLIEAIPNQMRQLLADATNDPQKAMTDLMSIIARMNACARARRCVLVKYEDTEMPDALRGDGCCPGQTGHHLLPGEMFYDRANCPGYGRDSAKHKAAPTICVEGTSNDPALGTHGAMHRVFGEKIADYKQPGFFKFGDRNVISYEDAREMAIDSVRRVFPESGCNPKCLRAQLDQFYEDLCKPKELNAKDGMLPGWLEKKINQDPTTKTR